MSTPAERRARRERVRNVGKGFVVVGLLAAAVAIFTLFVPVSILPVGGPGASCGGVIDAFTTTADCAAVLTDFVSTTTIAAVLALVTLAIGITVWARASR